MGKCLRSLYDDVQRNKTRLIVIDSMFPYGNKEPFLETEIKYLVDEFDVEIFCTQLYADYPCREHKGCGLIKSPNLSSKAKRLFIEFFFSFGLFFNKSFYRELRTLKDKKTKLLDLLVFLSCGDYLYSFLKRQLKKKHIDRDEKIIIYSYWMHTHAYVACRLKNDYKNAEIITRCHRYDVYENNAPHGYIPMRNYVLENEDHIYCISNDAMNYLKSNYVFDFSKCHLARLGTVDLGDGAIPSTFTIVSCSWMVDVKRIDRIIETLATISEEKIRWIHFGDGVLYDSLKKLSEHIPDNIMVEFAGKKTNQEVLNYYKTTGASLFLNVSSTEGIPVSIMEAMSFGIPVVATDVGGVAEIIDGNSTLLGADFDNEELKEAILKYYYMNTENYKAARSKVRDKWQTISNAGVNYSSFSRELLDIIKVEEYDK